ncbi:MAG: anthranilate phosphoribosyltransferase [Phycisphaerales bacterium]
MMKATLAELVQGGSLDERRAYEVFSIIMDGGAEESQIGALLALIARRGPTVSELTGAARVMREHVTGVPTDESWRDRVIDTCGTGGAPKTFNVSTAAALVAAGAGAKVAKHGNRSRSGRGSAEVLEALGVNVAASPETQGRCLDEAGVCFSFAIHHHPATRHATPARKALAFPTIFNLLGPLTNPAGAGRQLMGVFTKEFARLNAETLATLGCRRAFVVHGDDGLDEISTTARTTVFEVRDGRVEEWSVGPEELGIERVELEALTPTNGLDEAVRWLEGAIDGEAGPIRDITLVNAAAAIVVAGLADTLDDGMAAAEKSIDTGAARAALTQLVECSNG